VLRSNRQYKILVIDDDEIVLATVCAALQAAGHLVVTHDRATGSVALILQQKPDLVLIDVNLPHLSGDTIVGVVVKAQPAGDTVMLLHSGLSANILKAKAEAAGAEGFVQKTGDMFALVREVNRWLKRSGNSGRLQAAADSGYASSSSNLRAAPQVVDPRSENLRVGPELSLPSSGRLRVAREISALLEEEARPSGTRPVAPTLHDQPTTEYGVEARTQPPTVLLVDRDMGVLSTYRRYLQADELTVEYALSGSAALRCILSGNPPDAAVCDAFMTDLSGLDLYRRALAVTLSWRQRMVLTSDVQVPSKAHGFAEFGGHLLLKPVSSEALRNAVRACLAQNGGTLTGRAAAT
jgi:DNA-binding response OmpR family regulator